MKFVGWGLDALRLYRYVLGQIDGATPLCIASEKGRLSVVVALLDAGAALTVCVLGTRSLPQMSKYH